MNGLSLELVLGRAAIDVVASDARRRVTLIFLDAPEDPEVGVSSGGFAFTPRNGVRASAYLQGGRVFLTLTQASASPITLRLQVRGATLKVDENGVSLLAFDAPDAEATPVSAPFVMLPVGVQVTSSNVVVQAASLLVADGSDAVYDLLLTSSEARMEIADSLVETSVRALAVPPFDPGDPPPVQSGQRYVVNAGSRVPEFAVGVYDDAAFQRPRPLRFGVPVVSTVPVDGPGIVSGSADSQWIALSTGGASRTMYFKVVCNRSIETLASGMPSALVQLNLYLPAGLDTLTPPIPVQLLGSSDGSGNVTYYYGQYTFHQEDTVDYVDGFAYLLVSPALTIRRELPIRLQVSRSGTYTWPTYGSDWQQSAGSVSLASVTTRPPHTTSIVAACSLAARASALYAPRVRASHPLPMGIGVHRKPNARLDICLVVRRPSPETIPTP